MTFKLTNPTRQEITGVNFTDTFPSNLKVANPTGVAYSGCGAGAFSPALVPNDTSLSFSNGTLAPNSICTITVSVTALAGTYPNTTGNLFINTSVDTGNTGSDTLTASSAPPCTPGQTIAQWTFPAGFNVSSPAPSSGSGTASPGAGVNATSFTFGTNSWGSNGNIATGTPLNTRCKIVFATMEEGIYEVDIHSLAVKELWADEQRKEGRHANLPGYDGKGFYSAQGRYVYANNGDHATAAREDPTVPSGVLAEWDGQTDQWTIVRRNQFTDVTGPGGIEGNQHGDDRLWSIGWDNRSLLLMLLENGVWHSYRLPKASHCYDGAHGWNTEWPRIRDIGEDALLMTMHGEFWKFPKAFSAANTAGITPRSSMSRLTLVNPISLGRSAHTS